MTRPEDQPVRRAQTVEDMAREVAEGNIGTYHFLIPMEGDLEVDLAGTPNLSPNQQIVLKYSGREGRAPRSVDGHHGVSTGSGRGSNPTRPYMIVTVYHELEDPLDPDSRNLAYYHPILDRGICWVHSGNPGIIAINIEKKDIDLKAGTVKMVINDVMQRTAQVINNILSGNIPSVTTTASR